MIASFRVPKFFNFVVPNARLYASLQQKLSQEADRFYNFLAGTEQLQQELLHSMLTSLPTNPTHVPEYVQGWDYTIKQSKEYPLPCYVRSYPDLQKEQVIVDLNSFQNDDITLSDLKISKAGNMVAFTVEGLSATHDESHALFVSEIGSSAPPILLSESVGSIEWSANGRTILATRPDDVGRPGTVVGIDIDGTCHECMYEEKDPKFFLQLTRTKDWSCVIINSNSKRASEVRLIPRGSGDMLCMQPRMDGLEYFVESQKDQWVVLSNSLGGSNYGLFTVKKDSSSLRQSSWECVIPPDDDSMSIEDLDMFREATVLYTRRKGRQHVALLDRHHNVLDVPLPEWALSVVPGANPDYGSQSLRLNLSNPLVPPVAYDYIFKTKQLIRHSIEEIEAGHTRQIHVPSLDGQALIPLTLVSQSLSSSSTSSTTPCLVIVYGAYGHNIDLEWNADKIALLQRGWLIAHVHARGGGELGRAWHKAGRLDNTYKTTDDLAACLQYILHNGMSSKEKIVVETSSAGAVAVGGLLNNPDHSRLIAGAILQVPFVDVLGCMLDDSSLLALHERDEWGDPTTQHGLETLRKICPLSTIRRKEREDHHPAVLATCGTDDVRVPAEGVIKYIDRLRESQGGASSILLLPDAHRGHFPREKDRLHLKSKLYAWACRITGEDRLL